mmetsp:Transcript_1617/g.2135  ORF Transcript_1617/g.2135 Transcript_1617/m.2135 type:complete len:89 (-) Transcript_1617:9-275(-)
MTASLNKALSQFAPPEGPAKKPELQQKAMNLNFNVQNMNQIHTQLTGQHNFLPGLMLLGDGNEQHQPPIIRKENRMVRRQMVTRSLNF